RCENGAMQHGSARPLAVKYITAHGRRHRDHGLSLAWRARLSVGSVAPDALKLMPKDFASSVAASRWCCSSRVRRSNRAWSGRAMPDGIAIEVDQPLQIDLLDTHVVRYANELRELGDRLLQSR